MSPPPKQQMVVHNAMNAAFTAEQTMHGLKQGVVGLSGKIAAATTAASGGGNLPDQVLGSGTNHQVVLQNNILTVANGSPEHAFSLSPQDGTMTYGTLPESQMKISASGQESMPANGLGIPVPILGTVSGWEIMMGSNSESGLTAYHFDDLGDIPVTFHADKSWTFVEHKDTGKLVITNKQKTVELDFKPGHHITIAEGTCHQVDIQPGMQNGDPPKFVIANEDPRYEVVLGGSLQSRAKQMPISVGGQQIN